MAVAAPGEGRYDSRDRQHAVQGLVSLTPARDGIDICLGRGMLAGGPAVKPRREIATSWPNARPCTMTVQVLSVVLLICLGMLLGASWTIQALQPKLCRQAEERRRLNEEWRAVRTARQQRRQCPSCGGPLSEWH